LKNLALADRKKNNDVLVIFENAFLFAENTCDKVSIHITGEEIW
jgi:hypothetical protein